MHKISVIIPVYNSGKFFDKCMESVTNQTFQNLEIILVDDGSTDGSGKNCDSWAQKDARIMVVHQCNKGVSAARNCGLELANGDVISFIDADDTLDRDMYELLISFMDKYDADIAHCGYRRVVGNEVRLVHDTKKVYVQDASEALECLVGGKLFVGGLWNKIFRANIAKRIRFREDVQINEDILYAFEAFRVSKKTVFADYAKYNYIAHQTSSACFVTPNVKKAEDACKVNQYIYDQLKNTSIYNAAVERYMRSLSVLYRISISAADKKQCREIERIIWKLYIDGGRKVVGRNMRITAILLRYSPALYQGIYWIYDKFRKPNWDVGGET